MKNILSIILAIASYVVIAQDYDDDPIQLGSTSELSFKSKKGFEVLPQEGDWGIGVGATTLLRYVGNSFNSTTNNNSSLFNNANDNIPGTVFYGKYFKSSELAYRGYVRLNYARNVDKFEVSDDASTNPDDYVTDVRTSSSSGFTVGLGLEKRRGYNRLIGIYGAQVYVNLAQSTTDKYTYGNQYTASNQNPSRTLTPGNPTSAPTPDLGDRLIKANRGSSYGLGAQIFLGAEYYFAPRMSLGGEFYWGVSYTKDPIASVTYERFDPTDNSVKEDVSKSVGGSNINAGLSNAGGAVNLFLYF